MNLSKAAIVLRPRTVSEVLDLGFRFTFSTGLKVFSRLAGWVLLPAFALLLAARYGAGVSWLWVWPLALALAVWLDGPFTIAASRLMFGESLTARATLRQFAGRAVSYTMATVLKAIYLALASLPLFIPLIAVWPQALFVTEASVLEQADAKATWGRSKRLVHSRANDATGALFAWVAMRVLFVLGVELLCQAVVDDLFQFGTPFGTLFSRGGTPYALAGLLLSTPLIATCRFLQYIDTRTRSDGWDVQVRFMAILTKDKEIKEAVA